MTSVFRYRELLWFGEEPGGRARLTPVPRLTGRQPPAHGHPFNL